MTDTKEYILDYSIYIRFKSSQISIVVRNPGKSYLYKEIVPGRDNGRGLWDVDSVNLCVASMGVYVVEIYQAIYL
jgi:hypothetical protein